ncbi:uncharacterized protein LOC114544116 [Dendronephthya gigantea]|uniref:uncharacterized protein LOC114544116 n=1 Tax=Dendronephthya gigantea TaxID=151771 RepID=UPI00106B7CC2|nr:uncharacterized protein LOC114544116 [Dendronephthya gigantea]
MAARKHGRLKTLKENEISDLLERSDIVADYAEDTSDFDENSSGVDENFDPRGELFDDESSSTDDHDEPNQQVSTGENSVLTDLQNVPGQLQQEERTVHVHQRTGVPLTRKRQRNPASWKRNIRKNKRQSGEKYINSRGNEQAARSVKTKKDCSKCKFKCSSNVTVEDRSAIFNEFWKMSDNEKLHFYGKTTEQESTKSSKAGTPSRKKNSLSYSLPVNAQCSSL